MAPVQKASLVPPWSNLSSFGSKFTLLKKVLVTLLGLFGALIVIRRRENCTPLPPSLRHWSRHHTTRRCLALCAQKHGRRTTYLDTKSGRKSIAELYLVKRNILEIICSNLNEFETFLWSKIEKKTTCEAQNLIDDFRKGVRVKCLSCLTVNPPMLSLAVHKLLRKWALKKILPPCRCSKVQKP